MNDIIEIDIENDRGGMLHCPHCGGENLHQMEVINWSRESEDGPGLKTHLFLCSAMSVKFNGADLKGTRRNMLKVFFDCEQCPGLPLILCIIQHKGSTFIYWDMSKNQEI